MEHGKILMPGFINADSKVAMSIFRGYFEDVRQNDWVNNYELPAEKNYTEDDTYFASLLSFAEMIKSGTTCFCDSYFNEEATVKAASEFGIRGFVSNVIYRLNEFNEDKLLNLNNEVNKNELLNNYISLNYPEDYTLEELKVVSALAKKYNCLLKINYLETKNNIKVISDKYGKTVTDYLKLGGFFDGKSLLSNVVWVDEYDAIELRSHNTTVISNPISNYKFGTGAPDLKFVKDLGINIALGTGGLGNAGNLDMFEVMRSIGYSQRMLYKRADVLSAKEICEMATINSAKALGIDKYVGTIENGKKADLILIDINKPHLVPLHNVYSTLVYSCSGSDVDTTIVNGKIIMEERELVDINEKEVMKRAINTAKRVF